MNDPKQYHDIVVVCPDGGRGDIMRQVDNIPLGINVLIIIINAPAEIHGRQSVGTALNFPISTIRLQSDNVTCGPAPDSN